MSRTSRLLLAALCLGFCILLALIGFTAGRIYEADEEDGDEPTQNAIAFGIEAPRSSKWHKVAHEHLATHPACEVCGNTKPHELQVHHVIPFSVDASLELDPGNLLTICGPKGCGAHFWLAHLGNFSLSNPHVREDAAILKKRYTDARNAARRTGK